MTEWFQNASFEGDHFAAETGNVPVKWQVFTLDNEIFPGIGDGLVAFKVETQVPRKSDFPAHEQDVFVIDGSKCLKVFIARAPCYFALVQHVQGLVAGARYRATFPVYPDIIEKYDGSTKVRPGDIWSAESRAGVSLPNVVWPRGQDTGGGAGIQWSGWFNVNSGNYQFGAYSEVWVEFVAPESGDVKIWCESKAKWAGKTWENNFFLDKCRLEQLTGEPPVEPPVEPPDRQYPRTYNLYPPDTTEAEARAVFDAAWAERETMGGSADDAMIDNPNLTHRRVIAWYAHRWQGGVKALEAFRDEYYPGAQIEYRETDDVPTEPPIEPPTGGAPLVGPHIQMIPDDQRAALAWYMQNVKPGVAKAFSPHDAVWLQQHSPSTHVMLRTWANDQHLYLWADPVKDGARAWVDRSRDAIDYFVSATSNCPGLKIFLSLNEEMPTFNVPKLTQLVDFERYFLDYVDELWGGDVKGGIFNAAVGNPHETEVKLLLPAAQRAEAGGHVCVYHTYWGANPVDGSRLELEYQWLAGRWEDWARQWRADGCAPLIAGGEANAIGATSVHLPPLPGWRGAACYNGNWSKAESDFLLIDELAAQHNAVWGDQFLGTVWFTTSDPKITGWDTFQVHSAQITSLGYKLIQRYNS